MSREFGILMLVEPGEYVGDAAKEALEMAKQKKARVYLIFNNILTYAEPSEENPNACLQRWHKKLL